MKRKYTCINCGEDEYDGQDCGHCGFDASEIDLY
jgi:ribosomal protein L37E